MNAYRPPSQPGRGLFLRLASGAKVKVLEIFRTTLQETDEPCLALRYPTSKVKEELCSEAEEVWAAFKPIVETENLRAAVMFATDSGGGFTWIWKQDVNGLWDTPKDGDKGRTAVGLNGPDLALLTATANAIVRVRLMFAPEILKDPQYPNVEQQVIRNVLVVQTLKKTPDILGEAALRRACSAWTAGEKWPSSSAREYADYIVVVRLPVGDFEHGGTSEAMHLIPVEEGTLRHLEEALLEASPL